MKQLIIALLMTMLVTPMALNAADTDLFSYDQTEVEAVMADLDQLEIQVLADDGLTLDLLREQGNETALALTNSPSGMTFTQDGPLGIPSILWGFCFSVPGMIVVYMVTDSKDETIKSLWGCIISALLFGGGAWGFGWSF